MNTIELKAATPNDAELLSNLIELYIHDLSAVFPHVHLGADGRFGYPDLPRYWAEPTRRFPFLIRCDGRIAGFVLAKLGSPASDAPRIYDVAEFFVLRGYRHRGVGRRAALLLWATLPGRWVVRVLEENEGALQFWRGVVSDVAGDRLQESTLAGTERPWRVLSFDSTQHSRS